MQIFRDPASCNSAPDLSEPIEMLWRVTTPHYSRFPSAYLRSGHPQQHCKVIQDAQIVSTAHTEGNSSRQLLLRFLKSSLPSACATLRSRQL